MNSPGIGIDAFYCQPGLQGTHEKGGVEGQIGWSAATTVSRSQVDSFEQLNTMVDEWDAANDARRIGTRPHTIGEALVELHPPRAPGPIRCRQTLPRWGR